MAFLNRIAEKLANVDKESRRIAEEAKRREEAKRMEEERESGVESDERESGEESGERESGEESGKGEESEEQSVKTGLSIKVPPETGPYFEEELPAPQVQKLRIIGLQSLFASLEAYERYNRLNGPQPSYSRAELISAVQEYLETTSTELFTMMRQRAGFKEIRNKMDEYVLSLFAYFYPSLLDGQRPWNPAWLRDVHKRMVNSLYLTYKGTLTIDYLKLMRKYGLRGSLTPFVIFATNNILMYVMKTRVYTSSDFAVFGLNDDGSEPSAPTVEMDKGGANPSQSNHRSDERSVIAFESDSDSDSGNPPLKRRREELLRSLVNLRF